MACLPSLNPVHHLHQHRTIKQRQPIFSLAKGRWLFRRKDRKFCKAAKSFSSSAHGIFKNIIPTASYAIQLVCTVSFAILSDAIRHRARIMSISTFLGFFSGLVLAIWAIPSGLKWFAFFIQRAAVPYGPLSMSWANEICGADAEERAIVIGIMNSLGYAFNAWVPLLTYPQVDSPKFRKGFIFTTVAYAAQAVITATVAYFYERDLRRKNERPTQDEEDTTVEAPGSTAHKTSSAF